ncbi:type II toxin-antitoxin system VapC family toxin [soil metagenome]
MIVLDTNVVSEVFKRNPEPHVVAWLDRQYVADVFISAITAAELLRGVAEMPVGRRRSELSATIAETLETDFAERILPFSVSCAVLFAQIHERRIRVGRPIHLADALIAATALNAGADLLATRNVRDFEQTGMKVFNPWRS